MGSTETIRGNVADVRVVNDDIAATALITDDKFNMSVGKWVTGSWVSGSQTVFQGTAAFTVLHAFMKGTATGAGLATLKDNSGNVILTITTTVNMTGQNVGGVALNAVVNVVTATNSVFLDITAGGSVLVTAVNTAAGKFAFFYITTP